MNTLSYNLKNLREKKSLSIKQLCQKLDINTSIYNKIENGKKSIATEELRKLTDFYGVSPEFILAVKPVDDTVLQLKRMNLAEDDIIAIGKIFAMMDEAVLLNDMKNRL